MAKDSARHNKQAMNFDPLYLFRLTCLYRVYLPFASFYNMHANYNYSRLRLGHFIHGEEKGGTMIYSSCGAHQIE